jgi:hypothetical protein
VKIRNLGYFSATVSTTPVRIPGAPVRAHNAYTNTSVLRIAAQAAGIAGNALNLRIEEPFGERWPAGSFRVSQEGAETYVVAHVDSGDLPTIAEFAAWVNANKVASQEIRAIVESGDGSQDMALSGTLALADGIDGSGAFRASARSETLRAYLRCETQDVRFRSDGALPSQAASNGVLLSSGSVLSMMEGPRDWTPVLEDLRFVRAGGSDGAIRGELYTEA